MRYGLDHCPLRFQEFHSARIGRMNLMHKQLVISRGDLVYTFKSSYFLKNLFFISKIGTIAHVRLANIHSASSTTDQARKFNGLQIIGKVVIFEKSNETANATSTSFLVKRNDLH